MAWLMVSTWSLVDATTATLRPVSWWSIQVAAMPVEVLVEGAGDDPAVAPRRRRARRGSPHRSCSDAAASQAWVKRCRRSSCSTRPLAHSSASRPPRPTPCSWRGITDQGEPPPVAGRRGSTSWCRAGVDSMPASSTTSVAAGGQLELGQRWPVGALPLVEELGDGVGRDAGVALERPGRLRGRRDAEHRRGPGRARSAAAAVSMRVLPAPAGPTTSTSRSSPATAAAASACNGSRPSSCRRWWTVRAGRLGRPSPT